MTVSLSGGLTPIEFYRKMAPRLKAKQASLINAYVGDERYVPSTHPKSNCRSLNDNFIRLSEIPEENFHCADTQFSDPKRSAVSYEQKIRKLFDLEEQEIPVFDLIILGLGEDGHTASLFPDSLALFEKKRLIVSTSREYAGCRRITSTFPLINNADNVIFIVCGEKKSKILKRILIDRDESLPAVQVSPKNGKLLFLVDMAAGGFLLES